VNCTVSTCDVGDGLAAVAAGGGDAVLSWHAAASASSKQIRFITDIVYHVRYAARVKDRDLPAVRDKTDTGALDAEPPVVARMIVEIRSDGSRTIARGALEDVATGQRAAIEAKGGTPFQLALSLVRSLGQLPRFALTRVLLTKSLRKRLK
jgi:hypothetical protein